DTQTGECGEPSADETVGPVAAGWDAGKRVSAVGEFQPAPPQRQGEVELAGEEVGVNLLIRITRQDAERDSRMSVVEPAAHPLLAAVNDIDNAARRNSRRGLLDHLLKDPRMRRTPLDLQ